MTYHLDYSSRVKTAEVKLSYLRHKLCMEYRENPTELTDNIIDLMSELLNLLPALQAEIKVLKEKISND